MSSPDGGGRSADDELSDQLSSCEQVDVLSSAEHVDEPSSLSTSWARS